MRTIFISDAHLGSGMNEAEKELVLIEFLRSMSPETVSTIYILGDLFDFWFEYKSAVLSQYFRVLNELSRTIECGIDIHLVVGNHDYWAGDFLENTIGMKIHKDPIEIELDGLRIYMCHGDGLNPQDRGYRILKAIVRNRILIWALRLVHPDFILGMIRRFSKLSRESTSVAGKLREDDGIHQFALRKMRDGVDVVIAGHSHQPHDEIHTIDGKSKRYYNVGDMYERFSYLEYSGGQFRLKNIDREQLSP
jgi:UDP-2,3-diacylglucosamine hydrolase